MCGNWIVETQNVVKRHLAAEIQIRGDDRPNSFVRCRNHLNVAEKKRSHSPHAAQSARFDKRGGAGQICEPDLSASWKE